jgi:hypothetical protein
MARLAVLLACLAAALTGAAPAQAHDSSGSMCRASNEVLDPTPNDLDDDCVTDSIDNCYGVPNPDQVDSDGDGRGDACQDDDDSDGIPDTQDNCRTIKNPGQENTNGTRYGDACFKDSDRDGTIDAEDNCWRVFNPDQANNDRDAAGDVCDADDDNDGALDRVDNCPLNVNKDQSDVDGDGIGDACDPDTYTGPAFVAAPVAPVTTAVDRTKVRVSLRLPRKQRVTDARGGMPAGVRCSEACSVSATLTLSKPMARKLKAKAVIAKGEAALDAAGGTYVFFDFTRRALKRLFRGPTVRATLVLNVADAAGNVTTVRRTVRLAH